MLETAWSSCRPKEIMQWISNNNSKVDNGELPESHRVEAFVAIDDRPLLHETCGRQLQGHFVQTNMRRGMTKSIAESAISCLNSNASQQTSSPPSRPASSPILRSQNNRGEPSSVSKVSLRSATQDRLSNELQGRLHVTNPMARRRSPAGSAHSSPPSSRSGSREVTFEAVA